MRRAILGAAASLWMAGLYGALTEALGRSAAPALLLLVIGLPALGLGCLGAGAIRPERKRRLYVLITAALIAFLSLGWEPLLRLGAAVAAGRELASPSAPILLLLALLPVGIPALILGASLGLARPARATALLAGASLGLLVAGWILLPMGWRTATGAAGALLLFSAVLARTPKGGDVERASASASLSPALAALLLVSIGLGAGLAAAGLWRAWEDLFAARPVALVLGPAALLAAAALGGRLRGVPAPLAASGLAVAALLLPALPPAKRILEALLGEQGGVALLAWLISAALVLLPAGVAARGALESRARELGAGGWRSLGWGLVGLGTGWGLAGWGLLPSYGFARTCAIGALVGILCCVSRARAGLAAALAGGLAAAIVLVRPSTLATFHDVDPGRGERIVHARDTSAGSLVVVEDRDGALEVRFAGRLVLRAGAEDLANRVLTGHLAPLLRPELRRAFVVTGGSARAASALRSHGMEVDLRTPPPLRDLPSVFPAVTSPGAPGLAIEDRTFEMWPAARREPDEAGVEPAPEPRAIAPGLLPAETGLILTLLPLSRHPLAAPWYRPAFYQEAASSLAGGGILCQLVNLEELGVGGAEELLSRVARSFPHVDLWSFDLGAGGEYLIVASSEPLPIPYQRLEADTWEPSPGSPGDPALLEDVRLASGAGRSSLWKGLAMRVRTGEERKRLEAAGPGDRESVRRAVYGRQRVRWSAQDTVGFRGGKLWLLPLEIETGVSAWTEGASTVEVLTQLVRLPAIPRLGVHREYRWNVQIEGRTESLSVLGTPTLLPDREDILQPLVEAGEEQVVRSGLARIQGHQAPWHMKQLDGAPREQTLLMSWFCPIQGRKYFLRYRTVEGSPNQADPLVAWVMANVACHHPEPGGQRRPR